MAVDRVWVLSYGSRPLGTDVPVCAFTDHEEAMRAHEAHPDSYLKSVPLDIDDDDVTFLIHDTYHHFLSTYHRCHHSRNR